MVEEGDCLLSSRDNGCPDTSPPDSSGLSCPAPPASLSPQTTWGGVHLGFSPVGAEGPGLPPALSHGGPRLSLQGLWSTV